MMFFWIFLIPLIFYLLSSPNYPVATHGSIRDAMDILRERYARGEIEADEFAERQSELSRQ